MAADILKWAYDYPRLRLRDCGLKRNSRGPETGENDPDTAHGVLELQWLDGGHETREPCSGIGNDCPAVNHREMTNAERQVEFSKMATMQRNCAVSFAPDSEAVIPAMMEKINSIREGAMLPPIQAHPCEWLSAGDVVVIDTGPVSSNWWTSPLP